MIYQYRLMNLNYKDSPYHGAVICNYCRNCWTIWSHDNFQGIIPNNIQRTIEIVHNQRMLTDGARVRMTFKVCLLISVICQESINSHGPDNRGNRSFTNNYLPCKYRFLTVGWGGAVPGVSGVDFMTSTSADTYFTNSSVAPLPFDLTFLSAGLCPLSCLFL